MTVRHFLSLMDCSQAELAGLLKRGIELKDLHRRGVVYEPLKNRVLGMIFEKASTRTRVSFEAGMVHLGGQAIFLSPRDTQLGRGEPVEDSARVLSSMCDAVMIRTFAHATVETFAAYSRVPVINGLSDDLHPCQLLADMQTYLEHRGSIKDKVVVWVGDVAFGSDVVLGFGYFGVLVDDDGRADQTFGDFAVVVFLAPGAVSFGNLVVFVG